MREKTGNLKDRVLLALLIALCVLFACAVLYAADEPDERTAGLIEFRGKMVSADEAARIQKEDDARNVDRSVWSNAWQLDTDHFYIRINLDGNKGRQIRDNIGRLMEKFHADFCQQFKLSEGSQVYRKFRDRLEFDLEYGAEKVGDENDGVLYKLKDGRMVIVCHQADEDAININWRATAAILMFPDAPKNEVRFYRSGQVEGMIDGTEIKTVQPVSKKPRVMIFRNQGEYHTIGGGPANSGGYYSPWQNQICVPFLGLEDKNVEQFLHVLFHEATHYFVRSCIYDPPIWFNEALADYFGASAATGKYTPGRMHPPYVEWVKKAVKKGPGDGPDNFIPLHRLLNMSQAEFYGYHGWQNYATGWSLLFFLANGNVYPKKKIAEYYNVLRDGGHVFKSFEQVYQIEGQDGYNRMQDAWVAYWKKR